jgi:MOSC domain-containing protein YiiM
VNAVVTAVTRIQQGVMKATLDRDEDGKLVRKTGLMSIVVAGGVLRPGDTIRAELPPEPNRPLEVV